MRTIREQGCCCVGVLRSSGRRSRAWRCPRCRMRVRAYRAAHGPDACHCWHRYRGQDPTLPRERAIGSATIGERWWCRSGGPGSSGLTQGTARSRTSRLFDCWLNPMLASSIQRQLPILADNLTQHFKHSDWLSIGVMTGCLELVREHPRLLRSLTWKDPDYEGNALAVLIQIIENDPQNLTTISDYLVQKYPSAREGVNVSSRPIPGREVYFTPSVFEIPEQGIDQTLVAIMMPFAAEYRNVYGTIQRACAFHKLNCRAR